MANFEIDNKFKKGVLSFAKHAGKVIQKQSSDLLVKAKDTVVSSILQSESVANSQIQPYFICIQDNTTSVIDVSDLKNDYFYHDNKGFYFFTPQNTTGILINHLPVAIGKKHYLKNGDSIFFPSINSSVSEQFLIYSLMNQKNTIWESSSITPQLFEDINCSNLYLKNDTQIYLQNEENGAVYKNNIEFCGNEPLQPGDCVIVNNRQFVYTGECLIFQHELKIEEHKTLAAQINHISEDQLLDINIREKIVSVQGDKTKRLLKDIQLSIKPGEMILVLGGSGAGKTTFFNAVMGNEKADATICIGNHNLYNEFNQVRRMLAFVPQFDLLRPSDTVQRTLQNAAQMKLPYEISSDKRILDKCVAQVLDKLSLSRERDTLVSKLSGGQRKRLSVATEYIADPAIFFLDEPDSGLDGAQSITLMDNLRTIADDGKIVLVISHSPDRTRYDYDKVIVLAKNSENCGQLAYFGPIDESLEFFEVDNLESIVKVIDEKPDYFIEKYYSRKEG